MVGVINPPSGSNQTLSQYAVAASHAESTSYTQPEQAQSGVVVANTSGNNASASTASSGSNTPSATGSAETSATSTVPNTAGTNAANVADMKKWGVGAVAGGLAVALL